MTRRHRKNERVTFFRDEPLDLYEENWNRDDFDDEVLRNAVKTKTNESVSSQNLLIETDEDFDKKWKQAENDVKNGNVMTYEEFCKKAVDFLKKQGN